MHEVAADRVLEAARRRGGRDDAAASIHTAPRPSSEGEKMERDTWRVGRQRAPCSGRATRVTRATRHFTVARAVATHAATLGVDTRTVVTRGVATRGGFGEPCVHEKAGPFRLRTPAASDLEDTQNKQLETAHELQGGSFESSHVRRLFPRTLLLQEAGWRILESFRR